MRLAILGAGSVGFSSAVLAAEHGHHPVLWSPSGKRTALLREGRPLVARGAREAEITPGVAESCAEAMKDADAVLVAATCESTRAVIDTMVPVVRPGQTVILSSHSSLSALYLSEKLAELGLAVPIVALGTTIAYSNQPSSHEVFLWVVRDEVQCATVPVSASQHGLDLCRALFGDRFAMRENVLATSLGNVNATAHMGMLLGNFTRVEVGDRWHPFLYTTPSCARVIEALDRERLDVAAAIGASVSSFNDVMHATYHVPTGPVAEMFRAMYEKGHEMEGPTSIDTRWLTQDIPFIASTLETIAGIARVPVPIHEATITMFSTMYGRDLRASNDILPRLQIAGMTMSELLDFARLGHRARVGVPA